MDSASFAVNNFLKKDGNEDTTVDEKVAPAVEHETKIEEHEEREKTVVDKERHQDHYHTTVQPLKDQEVLPTKHESETVPTQYKEIEHDDDKIKEKVEAREQAFKDTSKQGKTVEKHVDEQTEVGEHVHHHLHETIQPVIEKQTIQPTVTHVTKPIKEKHHEASHDHGVTKNEAISIDEFKRKLEGEPVQKKPGFEGSPDDKHK